MEVRPGSGALPSARPVSTLQAFRVSTSVRDPVDHLLDRRHLAAGPLGIARVVVTPPVPTAIGIAAEGVEEIEE